MNRHTYSGLVALLWVALACRPVLAISWNEFLIIGILFAALLGPSLYRLVRRVEEFLKRKDNK